MQEKTEEIREEIREERKALIAEIQDSKEQSKKAEDEDSAIVESFGRTTAFRIGKAERAKLNQFRTYLSEPRF